MKNRMGETGISEAAALNPANWGSLWSCRAASVDTMVSAETTQPDQNPNKRNQEALYTLIVPASS